MKDNATTQPTKKKRLMFWLVLAVSLLIIAAITVGVIFAVNGNGQERVIDSNLNDDNNGDEGNTPPPQEDNDDGNVQDTSSQYEFIVPVREVNAIKMHEFNWDNTMKWYRLHQAIDFAAPAGTDVLAAVDGTVTSIEKELDATTITISHADNVITVYKFVDPVENLAAGSKVNRGDVIGTVSPATGVENADGDHLHFEVKKNGELVDPDDYLSLNSK